jgi:hypothetical protein
MFLMQIDAPHLLLALEQQAQHSAMASQHPWTSAQVSFREWWESRRRATRNDDLRKDEQKNKIRARLQGSSIVIAFFLRPDDKEPMAQVTLPCDDEEKMTEFFGDDGVMLQQNTNVPAETFPLDFQDIYYREHQEGVEKKLKPTRVLIYLVDGQRGKIVQLLHFGTPVAFENPDENVMHQIYMECGNAGRELFALSPFNIELKVWMIFCGPPNDGMPTQHRSPGIYATVYFFDPAQEQDLMINDVDHVWSILCMMLESAALYD